MKNAEIKRFIFALSLDLVTVVVAFAMARALFSSSVVHLGSVLSIFLLVKLSLFVHFKLYKITWRYFSIRDGYNVFCANCFASGFLFFLSLIEIPWLHFQKMPAVFFLSDLILTLTIMCAVRISKRLYLEVLKNNGDRTGLHTLILGAGHTGEMILRDMMRHQYKRFSPAGFLDDDKVKVGTFLHGVKVLGSLDQFESMVIDAEIEAVIIAIPRLQFSQLKTIYSIVKKNSRIQIVKTVPRIYDYEDSGLRLKDLEEISIEDLIGRQIVDVDRSAIKDFIMGKVVLITGAGGSIGSEISAQVCSFSPEKIILFDVDETELHNLSLQLKKAYPQSGVLHFVVGDVRDEKRVEWMFQTFLPQVVFHAAAYKHVPLMEDSPSEAVKVNIFGTSHLAKIAARFGTDKFILISTDKAVRPTSVMGATKRISEQICKSVGSQPGVMTQFISVRFGNVLGSRGSVLPLFMEQIRSGGPVTVTHPDMKRYFMTIPEAVSLVLQASMQGKGNEIILLDMGEPVYILKLAEDLISLQGLVPYKDIDVEFVGMRAGEKLFEEMLTAEEGSVATKHNRVFVSRESQKYSVHDVGRMLDTFKSILDWPMSADAKIRTLLRDNVMFYGSEGLVSNTIQKDGPTLVELRS